MSADRESITRARAQAVLCLLLIPLAISGHAAPAASLEVRVTAGLDGVTKPGRWTPIRVDISSTASRRADLLVEWGAASLRRSLEIAAGATQRHEVYLQTMAVGATVAVRVVAGAEELGAATAALRTLRADEPFTVCVVPSDGGVSGACTARPAAATLPRSLRGYDAADRVVIDGDHGALSTEQRSALTRWRALKALDDEGSLSATDRPRSIMPALASKGKTGGGLRAGIVLYVLALFGTGLAAAALRLRAPAALAAIALVVIAGATATVAVGRSGWPSAVLLHHATLVQQLPGERGSIVTMQGALEFPANGHAAVHALVNDAAFAGVDHWRHQSLDESGYPGIAGTFGLGQRQPFTLFAVHDFAPILVARRGTAVVVSNLSEENLSNCRFANGALAGAEGILPAGGSVSAELEEPVVGPVVTCALASLPVPFTAGARDVRPVGRTILAAYLPATGEGAVR
jgi:hypothetical protein